MSNKKIILSISLALAALSANAQTFLDNLRKAEDGKGKVTVTQSKEIDSLVNGTKPLFPEKPAQTNNTTTVPANPTTANTKPNTTTASAPANTNNNNSANNSTGAGTQRNDTKHETNTPATPTNKNTAEESPTVDTRKKVMRNSYKTQGYRIQVFSGGNSRTDRQKAENTGNAMKAKFPNEPVYVHFYSPSWKCRMGNYKTMEEAKAMLSEVKKAGYSQACIIKGTINVQY